MEALGQVAPEAIRLLLRRGPMSPGKLAFAWRLAVGPAIDRATEVRQGANGAITVVARDAAWRRELKRSQQSILANLKDLLGPAEATSLTILAKDR